MWNVLVFMQELFKYFLFLNGISSWWKLVKRNRKNAIWFILISFISRSECVASFHSDLIRCFFTFSILSHCRSIRMSKLVNDVVLYRTPCPMSMWNLNHKKWIWPQINTEFEYSDIVNVFIVNFQLKMFIFFSFNFLLTFFPAAHRQRLNYYLLVQNEKETNLSTLQAFIEYVLTFSLSLFELLPIAIYAFFPFAVWCMNG